MSLLSFSDTLRQVNALHDSVTRANVRIAELEQALSDEKSKVADLTNAINSAFQASEMIPLVEGPDSKSKDVVESNIDDEDISSTDPGDVDFDLDEKASRLSCFLCDRTFATKANLNSHTRVHTKKPHVCPECNKVFSSKGYLKRHLAYGRCVLKA